jgi:pimeloyl-ACP methyl ester carboxylesterase
VRIEHLVDDAERLLDRLAIPRGHLAGHSMGGWVALELARRNRALSVCALSPAGCWRPGAAGKERAATALLATVRDARRGRFAVPLLARSAGFRRWASRLVAVRGERLSAADVVELTDDLVACTIADDLLDAEDTLAPFLSLPCPITLAWPSRDRVFPAGIDGARARELVPGARFVVLEQTGHIPMLDAPELVARTILDSAHRVTSEEST